MQHAQQVVGMLKALGVQVAIDDFGTGYSSLSSLHEFAIDVIKLDRSFVSSEVTDENGRQLFAIAHAIVRLAQNLGVRGGRRGCRDTGAARAAAFAGLRNGTGLSARPTHGSRPDRRVLSLEGARLEFRVAMVPAVTMLRLPDTQEALRMYIIPAHSLAAPASKCPESCMIPPFFCGGSWLIGDLRPE